jgi:hypothetical protein
VSRQAGRLLAHRYELAELLGQGGMGYVWQAHDHVLDRDVAVKEVCAPDPDGNGNRRAFREARAAARLNHPGIVTVHDVLMAEGRLWIVMELVRAPSLEDVLRRDGPLRPERVAFIGLTMVEALRAAHGAGIIHRDIKPANVLLTEDRAVITDFGIATIRGEEKLTGTGQIIGTPAYMAPEQARGEPASRASDLWSLGAALYAAVTGHPPARTGMAVGAGALTLVLDGLLKADPCERLTAEQAAALLGRVVSGAQAGPGPREPVAPGSGEPARTRPVTMAPSAEPGEGPAPARSREPGAGPWRGQRWRRAAIGAAAVLAVLAVAGTLAATLSSGSGPGPTSAPTQGPAQHPAPPVSPPAIGPAGYPAAAPKIPAAYRRYVDEAGNFSVAVPHSWLTNSEEGGRLFCAPGGCPEAVFIKRVKGSDPAADIRDYPLANGRLPSVYVYRRLWTRKVSYYAAAAEAEFIIRRRGTPDDQYGLVRLFSVASGGTEYYMQVTAPSARWRGTLPVFAVCFATFRAIGTSSAHPGKSSLTHRAARART